MASPMNTQKGERPNKVIPIAGTTSYRLLDDRPTTRTLLPETPTIIRPMLFITLTIIVSSLIV